MKQITKRVGDLEPAPYNPRRISRAQSEALGRSMREFGDLSGIVVNVRTNRVVGGHQRLKHLDPSWTIQKAKSTDQTSTVAIGSIETPWGLLFYREVDWPEAKEKAANLAANKHGGVFDDVGVAQMLGELQGLNFDLDLTGFLADERWNLLGSDDKTSRDADGAPAAGQAKPRAKKGELWLLGEHRLMVGDSTDGAAWKRLFSGKNRFDEREPAAMVFTDPPYGVSYEAKSGNFDVIEGDRKRGDELFHMLTSAFIHAKHWTAPTAGWYIWHASSTREDFAQALKAAGLVERQYLVWAKPGIVLGHSDYRWSHEPCFYASRADNKPAFYGDRDQPTVWRLGFHEAKKVATVIGPGVMILDGKGSTLYVQAKAPKGKKLRQIRLQEKQSAILAGLDESKGTLWEVSKDHGYQHPTQKPVELARRAIENSSKPGQVVVDCFGGSGSTLVAADIAKRVCFTMELDPKYADVIIERWETWTGGKATKA